MQASGPQPRQSKILNKKEGRMLVKLSKNPPPAPNHKLKPGNPNGNLFKKQNQKQNQNRDRPLPLAHGERLRKGTGRLGHVERVDAHGAVEEARARRKLRGQHHSGRRRLAPREDELQGDQVQALVDNLVSQRRRRRAHGVRVIIGVQQATAALRTSLLPLAIPPSLPLPPQTPPQHSPQQHQQPNTSTGRKK